MPQIKQLDPHVANLIAAGEVVERPASVAKELMENAIDAGAHAVTVEIQNGGMALLRVTDDGGGIHPDDLETAFLRHATSKLRSERDLEAIGTLGFRGEALAAVAAVSRVEVFSRVPGAPLGASLRLEGGVCGVRQEAGCPEGTTLVVRDLFFNTPARLKFIRRDAAEGAAVFAVVQRIALSHPEVSVKFIRDGTQELMTPGDGQLRSAVYSVLGRDLALGFTAVQAQGESCAVTGFVSMPVCCRGTRGQQFFFLNGRYIKNRTLTAALEEAYRNQKMVGKFPGCVLHLTTGLGAVDVNVHPTKLEVKFQNEKQIFDAVHYAVRSALEGEVRRPSLLPERAATAPAAGAPDALTLRDGLGQTAVSHTAAQQMLAAMQTPVPPQMARPAPPSDPPAFAQAGSAPLPAREEEGPAPASAISTPPRAAPTPAATAAPPAAARDDAPAPLPWRVAGEVLNTYVVVEQGARILLIDKHAAHERIHFDRMKAQDYRPMAQTLLAPVTVSPSAEEGAALLAHLPLLAEFGFEAEEFGGGALLVRQAPFDIDPGQVEEALTELAGRLLTAGGADPAAARDGVLHTLACKAAIKGGQKNGPEELHRVAEAVMSGQVKYCPHGRPVAIELTQAQLERQFKRA